MATKAKAGDAKVPVLKGQEAEDKILEYLRKMNRPFGAVDVAANLKGAVPKATTQKILVALAEKGEVTQKQYAKTTFFVANQDKLEAMPAETLSALEASHAALEDATKALQAEVKAAAAELAKLKATPTDAELTASVASTTTSITDCLMRLEPLRSGAAAAVSADDLALLDAEWTRWRAEWVRRRKVFNTFWCVATDALPPADAAALSEDLGIETDTGEHAALERGGLCVVVGKGGSVLGKRRR